ncbi:MAG: MBL fold metallo-hydrolase [Deltaproteobacteria bacterium]|jgi:phosphoribosyl 1,2-cyclic phosphodiesterase|nr:MBL fold metallo-hydrolase [Deltaproteobacteria bacterium]
MIIKFWGVRGSIPSPPTPTALKERLKAALMVALEIRPDPNRLTEFLDSLPDRLVATVGGNTPCLEIRDGDDFIIIDAGTGINALGRSLSDERIDPDAERLRYLVESQYHDLPFSQFDKNEKILNINLLFTHTHWDHIQGFPFFTPLYQRTTTINIYGKRGQQIHDVLRLQQSDPILFPVCLDHVAAKLTFHDFPPEGLKIGPFEIESLTLPHPGGSLAFKIRSGGKTVVFATDYEFVGTDTEAENAESRLSNFIEGADVFVSDTQYTFLESMTKEGWGHSSPLKVAEMALHAGVKKFFLFHHDPFYSDQKLYEMLERTHSYTKLLSNDHGMFIDLAIEGRQIEV